MISCIPFKVYMNPVISLQWSVIEDFCSIFEQNSPHSRERKYFLVHLCFIRESIQLEEVKNHKFVAVKSNMFLGQAIFMIWTHTKRNAHSRQVQAVDANVR